MSREQATGAEHANGKPATFDEWYVPRSYQMFVGREGVPLYQGSALESLLTLPLGE
jgi:hypothetical protein